ncbi:MAG TPA: hypothetical protein PK059_00850 [Cyclobacteriaceae bacterium]|nr:hypothetical protein [Cyclobacteriaceae bacterium]
MNIGLTPRPIVVLTTFLLLGFAGFNIFLRSGFSDTLIYETALLGGTGLFLILAPHAILANRKSESWLRQPPVISVGLLLLLCLIGYTHPASWLPATIAVGGYGLLLIQFRKIPQIKPFPAVGYSFLTLLFTIWAVSVVWGGYHLRPTFLETLAVSGPYFVNNEFYNADMVYHLSIGQMLKYYGAASTGLDGLPLIYYHYGSHWVMAQLSWFTGLPLVYVYNYGYPLVLLPLFFSVFIQFALLIQQHLFAHTKTNVMFILTGMCLFIQVPGHLYAGGLLGISGLVNDSFILSLTILFTTGYAAMVFWRSETINPWIFFAWLMAMTGAACMIKISTGFVLCGTLGYLFLRLKLFRRWQYWTAAAGIAGVFLVSYWFTSETLPFGLRKIGGDDGIAEAFHFYTSTHEFEPLSWFAGFYCWLYLVIVCSIVFFHRSGANRWSDWWMGRYSLMVEVPLVIAVIGVVPSLLMVFSGGNSMYFSGIQLFVSGALLMAYSHPLQEMIMKYLSRWSARIAPVTVAVVMTGLVLLMYTQVRWHFNRMIQVNVQTRAEILGITLEPEWRVHYDQSTFGIYNKPVANAFDTIRSGIYLRNLMKLESLKRRDALLFINYQKLSTHHFRNIACIETAFLAPAFSGYAMLDGLSYQCNIGMYGDGYYQRNLTGNPDPTDSVLCRLARDRGKMQLLKYNPDTGEAIPLSCDSR